jgi:hypothetical protein
MAMSRYSGVDVIGAHFLAEMVICILGAGSISSVLLTTAENREASQTIRDGMISILLIQPINPHWI